MPSVKRCLNVLRRCRLIVQKTQRLHQAFSRFIGSHLVVAFDADPEAEIRKLNTRRCWSVLIANHENDNQQSRVQFEQAKEGAAALNRIQVSH